MKIHVSMALFVYKKLFTEKLQIDSGNGHLTYMGSENIRSENIYLLWNFHWKCTETKVSRRPGMKKEQVKVKIIF